MPLAIYNTKQYDIHLLSLLCKTTSTGGCRDRRHHSIRHQYIYPCSNAHVLGNRLGQIKMFTSSLQPFVPSEKYYGANEYLGDQEKAFYFEGIRKLEQRLGKCIALKGD